ncbi:MAG: hypothetical protein AAFV77_03250 [Planctomycetota bacterium]
MTAVRTRIVQALAAAIENIDIVGGVAEPSVRDEAADGAIIDTLKAQQAYVEMGIGADEPGQDHSQLLKKTFPVTLICHLPDTPPSDQTHLEFAGAVYGAIVALIEDESDPSVGTWGELAEQTIDQGGGGIGLDPGGLQTLVTVVQLDIVYRHTRGDIEAVR